MECRDALRALRTAEPGEERPEAGTELSRHLESCPACRSRARALDASLAALDDALEGWAARGSAERAVAEARRDLERRDGGERGPAPGYGASVGRRGGLAGGLAVAAALALLFLRGEPEPRPGTAPETPPVAERGATEGAPPGLGLAAPPDRMVAVLETDDPEITIVWFF